MTGLLLFAYLLYLWPSFVRYLEASTPPFVAPDHWYAVRWAAHAARWLRGELVLPTRPWWEWP